MAADGTQDGHRGSRIRKGDDHRARALQARANQHLFIRGVSEDHRIPCLAGRADARWIEVQRDVFEVVRFKHARNVLPHAPEAAENDVLALGDAESCRVYAYERGARRPLHG